MMKYLRASVASLMGFALTVLLLQDYGAGALLGRKYLPHHPQRNAAGISLTANVTTLTPLQSAIVTASLSDTSSTSVGWSIVNGPGAIARIGPTTAIYTAPDRIIQPTPVTIRAHVSGASQTITLTLIPPPAPYWQNLVQFESGLARGNSKPYDLLALNGGAGVTPTQWQPNMVIFHDAQSGTEVWRLDNDPSDTYIPGIVNRTPWNADGSYFILGSTRNPTQNPYGAVDSWLYDARGGLQVAFAPFDPNRQPDWTQKLPIGNGYLPPDRVDPNVVYAVTYDDNNNGTWSSVHSFLYAIDLAPDSLGRRFKATAVAEIPNVVDPVTGIQSATVRKEIRSQLAGDDRILVNDQNPNAAPATTDPGGYPKFYLYDGTKTDAVLTANANSDPQALAGQLPLLTSYSIQFDLANDVPCAPGQSDTNPIAPCHNVSEEWHLHDLGFERDPADHIGINYGSRGDVGEYVDFLVPSLYTGDNSTISILFPNGNTPYFSHPGVADGDTAVVYEGEDTLNSGNYGVWLRDLVKGQPVREYEKNPFESGHSDWSGFDPNYFVFDGWTDRATQKFDLYEGLASPTANFASSGKGDRILVYYPPRDPNNTVSILYSPTQSPDATKVMFTIPDSFDPSVNAHLTSYVAVSHRPVAPALKVRSTLPVRLTWTPALTHREVAGYHVYRADGAASSGFVEISKRLITGTAFTDLTAVAGNTYSYAVTAEEYSGLESSQLSNILQVTAGGASSQFAAAGITQWDTAAPDSPTRLTVSQLAPNVWKLTWRASRSRDVRYYDVYVSMGTAPQPTQPYLVDSPPLGQTAYIYWQGDPDIAPVFGVTAVDRQDNQSFMACIAAQSGSNACARR